MACMFNQDNHQAFCGPRISFSSDFVVEPPPPSRATALPVAIDSDFEFSVGSHPMMAADQLFSKGRILPLKDGRHFGPAHRATTLRDELRAHDDCERPNKGPTMRWKGLLGLKKAHLPPHKRGDKSGTAAAEAAEDGGGNGSR
ncbi:uncharacterized protein [Typha latifolia]|uniref:uncharacterized protein n=1 Tax=Typha latifolia TaxID=4733 RepID=UPI003C30E4B5